VSVSSLPNLEPIEYEERCDPLSGQKARRFLCPAYGHDGVLRTCKRRGCPRCQPNWAMDWFRINRLNLEHYGGPVVMVTITAPGEDRLPWDEHHCRKRREHKHYGPNGCRVQQRIAREWADMLSWRWAQLRGAARLETRRKLRTSDGELGPAPSLLLRAYEPQKRGVPHLHIVLGYGTLAERDAAHVFVGELKRLAGRHDFGFADGRGKTRGVRNPRPVIERHGVPLRPMGGADAARYLANYLTGRNSKKKNSIRDNLSDPIMPRSLLWLTPALSSLTASQPWIHQMRERMGIAGGTGITMRMLRKARHIWAALKGRCPAPVWQATEDAIYAVSVYVQAYLGRSPPEDLTPALQHAREVDRFVRQSRRWFDYQAQILDFALQMVEQCLPTTPQEVSHAA
jgi:hypothetical protein